MEDLNGMWGMILTVLVIVSCLFIMSAIYSLERTIKRLKRDMHNIKK